MHMTRFGGYLVEFILVIVIVSLLLGQAMGQPILLGFVETDSMEPTLDTNDGYIAIPSPFTGPIEQGDIIVFKAQKLHGGGLTTHRVVEKTEYGYITKGDANPFRDQEGNEPPVKDGQVVAKALQINGEVVVIPSLGIAVTQIQEVLSTIQLYLGALLGTTLFLGTQGLLNLIVLLCLLTYGLLILREQQRKQRFREYTRDIGTNTRLVVVAITLILLVSVTAAMVLPSGVHQIAVESNLDPGSTQTGLQPRESVTAETKVPNNGLLPVFVIFEPRTDGIEATPKELHIGSREFTSTEITVTAPQEEIQVNRILVEHRYLALLPTSVIRALYQFHPWAPIVVIDALIGIPFYLIGVKLVGTGRIRNRSRSKDLSFRMRFRRTLRQFY